MKFSCSYTDANGLTVSLSVSGAASFLAPEVEDEESPTSASDLANTFESCLPGITSRLVQAHRAIAQDLYVALASHLEKKSEAIARAIDRQVDEVFPVTSEQA